MEETEKFEDKIKIIESIIERLSGEEISLEDSLKLYSDGSKKIKEASDMLEKAEILFQELKQDHSEKAN